MERWSELRSGLRSERTVFVWLFGQTWSKAAPAVHFPRLRQNFIRDLDYQNRCLALPGCVLLRKIHIHETIERCQNYYSLIQLFNFISDFGLPKTQPKTHCKRGSLKRKDTHTHTASDVFDQFKLSWAQPPWLIEETPQVSKPIGVPNEPPFWTPNKTSLDALFVSNPSQQCSVVPNVFGRWLTCGEARGALPACRRVSKSRSSDLLILFGGLLLEFIGSSFVHMNLFYSSSP